MLGTFHAKYMVVDRKIALVCSCNIQDTDNMEMLCHLEGPIVDSVYDMALISWHKALDPPLPSRETPAAAGGLHSLDSATRGTVVNADGSAKFRDLCMNLPDKYDHVQHGREGTARRSIYNSSRLA